MRSKSFSEKFGKYKTGAKSPHQNDIGTIIGEENRTKIIKIKDKSSPKKIKITKHKKIKIGIDAKWQDNWGIFSFQIRKEHNNEKMFSS